MISLRKILHPTDFSDRAANAFRLATSLARDYSAELLVLSVSPGPILGYGQGIVPPEPGLTTEEIERRLQEYIGDQPGVTVTTLTSQGEPAEEIVQIARAHDCDLIVMGTHGWTGLSRLMMGSVAEQVLRRAHCPVLTVRSPFPAPEMMADHSALVEHAVGL